MTDDKARAPETGLPRTGESVDVRIARLEEQAKTFGTREWVREWMEERVPKLVAEAVDKWMRERAFKRWQVFVPVIISILALVVALGRLIVSAIP